MINDEVDYYVIELALKFLREYLKIWQIIQVYKNFFLYIITE